MYLYICHLKACTVYDNQLKMYIPEELVGLVVPMVIGGEGLGGRSGEGLGRGPREGLGRGPREGLGRGSGEGLGRGSGEGLGRGPGEGLGGGSGVGLWQSTLASVRCAPIPKQF